MRVGHLNVTRPFYFDRTASPIAIAIERLDPPHAVTTYASYTVPSGFKAFLESCLASVVRYTAAAAPGIGEAKVRYFGPGVNSCDITNLWLYDAAAGAQQTVVSNQAAYMQAGDILTISTGDAATGGTAYWRVGFKACQFVA